MPYRPPALRADGAFRVASSLLCSRSLAQGRANSHLTEKKTAHMALVTEETMLYYGHWGTPVAYRLRASWISG
jgi:hypothetical protein